MFLIEQIIEFIDILQRRDEKEIKFSNDAVKDRENRCYKDKPPQGPLILRANWISFCIIVTRLAWRAQRFLGKNIRGENSIRNNRVRIFKEMHKISLGGLLKGQKSLALPSHRNAVASDKI